MEMLNVDRAAAYLRTADDCLIYIHTNPDGDAVGSGSRCAGSANARACSAPTRFPNGCAF